MSNAVNHWYITLILKIRFVPSAKSGTGVGDNDPQTTRSFVVSSSYASSAPRWHVYNFFLRHPLGLCPSIFKSYYNFVLCFHSHDMIYKSCLFSPRFRQWKCVPFTKRCACFTNQTIFRPRLFLAVLHLRSSRSKLITLRCCEFAESSENLPQTITR